MRWCPKFLAWRQNLREINVCTGICGMRTSDTVVLYAEKDRRARQVLRWRMLDGSIPLAPIVKDIETLDARNLQCDIVTAGFPCQSLSCCGLQKGMRGISGRVFDHILRVSVEASSEWIFLENVRHLLSMPKAFKYILRALAAHGYSVRWTVNQANHFSLPHKRERVFLLARRTGVFILPYLRNRAPLHGYASCENGGTVVAENNIELTEYFLEKPLLVFYGAKRKQKRLMPTPRKLGGHYAQKYWDTRGLNHLAFVLKYSRTKNRRARRRWTSADYMEEIMGFPPGWTQRKRKWNTTTGVLVRASPENTARLHLLGNACTPVQCTARPTSALPVLWARWNSTRVAQML